MRVVLFEPEIPQNTGSIGRLCLATQSELHLIEPLGFDISDRALKRAGLDYWEHLQLHVHPDWEAFLNHVGTKSELYFLSKRAGRTIYEQNYSKDSTFVFGRETSGLPDRMLNAYASQTLRIPLYDARVRSLNLSQAAGIVVYEALRQVRPH